MLNVVNLSLGASKLKDSIKRVDLPTLLKIIKHRVSQTQIYPICETTWETI
jgi:hypothetical protein